MRGAVVLASLMVLLVPAVAWSAENNLHVSIDGMTWRNELALPLFGPDVRWVPGDVEVRSFYVRNQARSEGAMSISLNVLDDSDGLFDGEDFVVDARSSSTSWQRLRRSNSSYRLSDQPIAGGGQDRVDVRVSFDPGSANHSMGRILRAGFIVTLSQAPSRAAAEVPSEGLDGVLPVTGSELRAWWLWAGAALAGLGGAVVARSKHLVEKDSHV